MEEYFAAKWELFGAKHEGPAPLKLVHSDVKSWIKEPRQDVVFYGTKKGCDVRLEVSDTSLKGSKVKITGKYAAKGEIPIVGTHNTENFCAAFVIASHVLGRAIPSEDWAYVDQVPGRLENVSREMKDVPQAIVDYSHTPDSLAKTLDVLRPFARGKLWAVFGCGGDRDPGKRSIMGKVSEEKADEVVVTSDNPRSENPDAIIAQIREGISKPHYVYSDREDAIRFAIRKAQKDDIILIAGKGHEDYQIIGGQKFHFDDREIARKYLKQKEGTN
jgi:UDP-N-acetylmuramoyl-L-alanyl-D-glutamate--2,6-diaminopimelate ligase